MLKAIKTMLELPASTPPAGSLISKATDWGRDLTIMPRSLRLSCEALGARASLIAGPERMVFKVIGSNVEGGACVVKYCRRYGEAVHRAFAVMELAPPLISVDKEGPWWVVRMQHMAPEEGWLPLSAFLAPRELSIGGEEKGSVAARLHALASGLSSDVLQSLVARIESLLRKVHLDKMFVHGDVRPPNVLVKLPLALSATSGVLATSADLNIDSLPIVFVDFDWAGTEGEVRFPPLLNPRVPWPEGVEGGSLIRNEHDIQLLHATTTRKEATWRVRAWPWQIDMHSSLAEGLRAVLNL